MVKGASDRMKMLILCGPQGSGNHLFAKIFSLHDEVHGWKASLEPDGYFIPHWREPFNWYWNNIDKIDSNIMGGKQYAVTSISNPYLESYIPKIPPVQEFMQRLESIEIEPQLVVIGRDRNILTTQQTRLRGGPTWGNMHLMLKQMKIPPLFVSQELLYLYKKEYVRSLAHWLDFPVAWNDDRIDEILKTDANAKYITSASNEELDKHVLGFLTPPWQKESEG